MLKISPTLNLIFITCCSILIGSCVEKPHHRTEIEQTMQRYDRLIRKMDTDSIALLYTVDGALGNVARGRDSIRLLLEAFRDYQVLDQNSNTDFISIAGDTAFQRGVYHQTTITPNHDTVQVKGTFRVNWVWIPGTGWQIKQMITTPLPEL